MTVSGVQSDVRHGVVVARLGGDVDASNADSVLSDLTALVPNHARGLVLDLSSTRYLDSAGVNVIFELYGRLEMRRQHLRIVAAPGARLRRILELTGVAALVPLDESPDAAVDAVDGGSAGAAPGTTPP